MIICAHELKNGDVVQKPGPSAGEGSWHTIRGVAKTLECIQFTIDGQGYSLPLDWGVRRR